MTRAIPILLLLGVVAALFLLALAPMAAQQTSQALAGVSMPPAEAAVQSITVELDGIQVQTDANHADLTHGSEAAQVRSACQQKGHFQLWMEPDKKTFHRLCQLEDGRWGDWIVTLKDKIKVEKTAFIPKDGTWQEVIKWLARKGATRFTKPW